MCKCLIVLKVDEIKVKMKISYEIKLYGRNLCFWVRVIW